MGLFDKLKTKTLTIAACTSGKAVRMKDIADPVFADGILGVCAGIEPEEDKIHAPVGGVITQVSDTLHAIGLRTSEGAELLIHVGIDTVQMMGDGFEVCVQEGMHVEAGQLLMVFDRDKIRAAGYRETVVTAVTNADEFAEVVPEADTGAAVRAGDPFMKITRGGRI